MEFPTIKRSEEKKERIIKWRDVPENILYHIVSTTSVGRSSECEKCRSVYADLQDGEGNTFKTGLPDTFKTGFCIDLNEYCWRTRTAFVRPLGVRKSVTNPDRQYFASVEVCSECEKCLSVYADLQDEEGNTFKTWLPARLCIDLKDYGWRSRTAFVRLLGVRKLVTNPDQQYFDYSIMWAAC